MTKSWIGGRQLRKLRQLVIDTYGNECHLCHELIDTRLPGTHELGMTLDHVIARAHGGSNALENLRPAHKRCNQSRGSKFISQRRAASRDARFF